jgi:hypothetical protein
MLDVEAYEHRVTHTGLELFRQSERNTLRPLCDVLLVSLGGTADPA